MIWMWHNCKFTEFNQNLIDLKIVSNWLENISVKMQILFECCVYPGLMDKQSESNIISLVQIWNSFTLNVGVVYTNKHTHKIKSALIA